jgi:hypothetical protein
LANLVGGAILYKTKNPIKSIAPSGSSVTGFAYDYSADGKITKVKVSAGGVLATTYDYQYTCK